MSRGMQAFADQRSKLLTATPAKQFDLNIVKGRAIWQLNCTKGGPDFVENKGLRNATRKRKESSAFGALSFRDRREGEIICKE